MHRFGKVPPPVGQLASGLESLSGSDSPEASCPTGGSLHAINKQVLPFTTDINDECRGCPGLLLKGFGVDFQ